MTKAIRMYETGGPEVLRWEDVDPGQPGPGQVLVRHEAVGVNFIDVYHRTGLYPLPSFPATPGMEGAGVVEAIGEGVTEVAVEDRVAYAGLPPGAYAEARIIPAHGLVKLPDKISTRQGAGMMLRGMTARYLLYGCYRVKAGDTILVQAAPGGVGTICASGPATLAPRSSGRSVPRKGRACQSPRLPSPDSLQGGRFCFEGQDDHARTWLRRGL